MRASTPATPNNGGNLLTRGENCRNLGRKKAVYDRREEFHSFPIAAGRDGDTGLVS